MTTPDWPALWAKEPALRPDGLSLSGAGDGACWTLEGSGWCREYNSCSIDETTAAALCRDAAVRWLVSLSWGKKRKYAGAVALFGSIVTAGTVSAHDGRVCIKTEVSSGVTHWTLDAALYAACEAEVEARATAGEQQ